MSSSGAVARWPASTGELYGEHKAKVKRLLRPEFTDGSHSGFATISNSCDQGCVNILGFVDRDLVRQRAGSPPTYALDGVQKSRGSS
jgi:hypothetical protein